MPVTSREATTEPCRVTSAYAPGKVGQAFVFDGSGDGVVVGNPANLQLQNFTIEAWVKRGSANQASLSPGGGMIFAYGTPVMGWA